MMSRSLAIGVLLSSAALVPAQTVSPPASRSVTPPSAATPQTITDSDNTAVPRGWFQGAESNTDEPRITASADYLLWWLKTDRPSLPLLTTGGAGGGALGAADTKVLFRLSDLDKDLPYNGGQFEFGLWLSRDETVGVDAGFFFLQQRSFSFSAASNAAGSPLLSVPFFDLNPAINGPSFSQVSVPGVLVGSADAESTTRLWGFDVDFKSRLWRSNDLSVTGLLGYRQLDLRDSLAFTQDEKAITGLPLLSFAGASIPANDSLVISDRFNTHNAFHGCDFGLKTTWSPFSKFSVDVTTKIAFGAVTQTINVAGNTSHLNPAGAVVESDASGLFALANVNSGSSRQYPFAVLPEAALRLRYAVTDWLELSAGYDFLYLSSVARPGDQVSGTINSSFAPSQVPFGNGGPLAPAPVIHRTDFSAQGVTAGIEIRF